MTTPATPPPGYAIVKPEDRAKATGHPKLMAWAEEQQEWQPTAGLTTELLALPIEPPPAPVPPDGYRLLTDDEKTKCLNDDTMFFHPHWMMWKPSIYAGCFLPKTCYPDHFATRAPLPPEPLSDRLGSATWDDIEHSPAEPTASESSGDVHLWQAKSEIMRLKSELQMPFHIPTAFLDNFRSYIPELPACQIVGDGVLMSKDSLLDLVNRLKNGMAAQINSQQDALAAAIAERDETKNKLEELDRRLCSTMDELDGYRENQDSFVRAIDKLTAERDAALAAAHTKALAQEGEIEKLNARDETASRLIERLNEIFGDDVIVDVGHIVDLPEYEAWETASALATPSSAPAAVGEKVSAGPTPRTDKEIDDHHEIALHLVRASFARTLERELTASESLLTRARDTLWFLAETHDDDRAGSMADRIDKHLTPPVAGEGGEGK